MASKLGMRRVTGGLMTGAVLLAGCAGVREEDLKAWEGAPVAALDQQPVFLTMQMVRTVTPDGTEIRNYVNGAQVASCAARGNITRGIALSQDNYNAFSNCVGRFAACNNIFYIQSGRVTRYVPVGTEGARCYTDAATRPGFSSAVNVR